MATSDSEQNDEETVVSEDTDTDTGTQFTPVVKLEQVTLTTGEENHDVLLDLEAKLYRFDKNGNKWKERGLGPVKIIKHKENGTIRVVMRQSKTLKICANHFVVPKSLVVKHGGNEKTCVWRGVDFAEGELRDEIFCIRFGSIENMDSEDQGHIYFTNLLSQDTHIYQTYRTSPVTDFRPLPLNSLTGVKKSGRGVNFSLEEDKLLVSAWLHCIDTVHETDQKHSKLWEKIFEYFHQFKETVTDRTVKSLIQRWSLIHKATNKFRTQLAQVEELNQGDMNEQDRFMKAKIMYQSLEKCNFQFEHCWHMLKDEPKWISRATVARQRKAIFSSPTPTQCSAETGNVIENEVIEFEGPIGGKAGKRKRKASRVARNFQLRKMRYTLLEESRAQKKEEKKLRFEDERLRLEAEKLRIEAEKEQNKIRQEDERLRLEAEKIELAKKESDQRTMMMDVSGMSEMQRLYFEELQREIVMRRSHVSKH